MAIPAVVNETGSRLTNAAESGKQLVAEHPLPSAMTAFGIGVGVGLAIGFALAGSPSSREEEKFVRRVSHQVLGTLSGLLPDSLSKHVT